MKNDNLYLSDKDCETCVLGTLLNERNAIHKVREILSVDCFYSNLHKEIYRAILAITDRGERADLITIIPELNKKELEFQAFEIANIAGCHTFDLVQYACRLSDLKKRRALHDLGYYLTANGANESEELESVLQYSNDKLSSISNTSISHIKTTSDYLQEVVQRVNDNINGKKIQGTPTGLRMIDEKGGFQPTDLIIIGAESSQGKTALANSIALAACKSGSNIGFYSMEMSGSQLMRRFAAMESGIPISTLGNTPLSSEQIKKFDLAINSLSGLGIYFDDRSTSNIETILASIRTMVIKYQVQGVIIDYLQILTVNRKNGNPEESIAEAARRLKNIATELNIWVLALSQLSRDTVNPIPAANRLRGSGQINEASDMTILIYRPEMYGKKFSDPFDSINPKGTALIDIAKGRNIGTFKFITGFDSAITRFYDLNEYPTLAPSVKIDEPF